MKRDESKDIGVKWSEFENPDDCSRNISQPCVECVQFEPERLFFDPWSKLDGDALKHCKRYVPHEDLMSVEAELAKAKTELDRLTRHDCAGCVREKAGTRLCRLCSRSVNDCYEPADTKKEELP